MRIGFVKVAVVLLAALPLAACVESSKDPFAGQKGVTLFPDKFMAAGTDNYLLERDGDHYKFETGDGLQDVKFMPLPGGDYLVQVHSPGDGGTGGSYDYLLGIADASGASFSLVDTKSGDLATQLDIGNPKGDDDSVYTDSGDDIIKLISATKASADAQTTVYKILDYAIPEQRAQAKQLSKKPASQ